MYRYAERCGWMFHGVDDGGGAQSAKRRQRRQYDAKELIAVDFCDLAEEDAKALECKLIALDVSPGMQQHVQQQQPQQQHGQTQAKQTVQRRSVTSVSAASGRLTKASAANDRDNDGPFHVGDDDFEMGDGEFDDKELVEIR